MGPQHFLGTPLDGIPARDLGSLRFESVTGAILRLTISRACRCASERICTPNGKATPHRFAQAKAKERYTTVPSHGTGEEEGGQARASELSERFVISLSSSLHPDDRRIPFCFSFPPFRILFIRARATSTVTRTRLPQGAPSLRVALNTLFGPVLRSRRRGRSDTAK